MRPIPVYPPYRPVRVPDNKRWLFLCVPLTVLSGKGIALFYPAGEGVATVGITVLMAGLWLIRQLYYRVSVHNARLYDQLVEQQQQDWWLEHQQLFALRDVVLIGPAGTNTLHWLHLLKREHRAPEVKNEGSGKALRIARLMANTVDEREAQLAKLLVLQWQDQGVSPPHPHLQCCYWLGSLFAWRAFCTQMQVTFPDIALPDEPQPWDGEATLSCLATSANTLSSDSTILVAGCRSMVASFSAAQPAGEAAALLLIGHEGVVSFTRGEVYDCAESENLIDVFRRAVQQSAGENAPDACILFSQPTLPALAQSGWNVMHHVQDLNWGNSGDMEMLIVLALAAIYVSQHQEPCGWIAKDSSHTLALGIVKPYGQGK